MALIVMTGKGKKEGRTEGKEEGKKEGGREGNKMMITIKEEVK